MTVDGVEVVFFFEKNVKYKKKKSTNKNGVAFYPKIFLRDDGRVKFRSVRSKVFKQQYRSAKTPQLPME